MRERLQRRLEELKKEFAKGQARVVELEKQQAMVHQTLLRISGAIQVLEEELQTSPQENLKGEGPTGGDSTQADQLNGTLAHAV